MNNKRTRMRPAHFVSLIFGLGEGSIFYALKKAAIAAAIIAVIVGGLYINTRPTAVGLITITAGLAEVSFSEQGVVVAENQMLVFTSAQGEINGLYVQEGDTVQVGDSLLRVDDTALQLRLSQVEYGIRSLQAQLANLYSEDSRIQSDLHATRSSLQGELQSLHSQAADQVRSLNAQNAVIEERLQIQDRLILQNQADVNRAREEAARIETLYQGGVATRVEQEAAQNVLVRAETQLEASQHERAIIAADTLPGRGRFDGALASVNARIGGIDQQLSHDFTSSMAMYFHYLIAIEEAAMAHLEREIANSTVTAPVSGIITTLQAQNTNFISPSVPVAEITVPGQHLIEVYVSTEYSSSIRTGDKVGITLRQWDGDVSFYGTIAEIGDTAAVRFTFMGVEERKVNVRITPHIPEGLHLGIGYSADITFYVYSQPNSLIVPETALFDHENQYAVWVTDGTAGSLQARRVETGVALEDAVVITAGLHEGEQIVYNAANRNLHEGMRVRGE